MNTLRAALTASTAAFGLALAVVPLSTTAAATETPEPAFLSADEMPPSSTPWTAEPVADGLPEFGVLCAPDAFKAEGTRHRTFRTELDTGGEQVTTVAATEAEAAALVTTLRRALLSCGDRIEREYPDWDATSRPHGKLRVEDGAYVYSLDTVNREVGSKDIHLMSVGRDGRTVTYVKWGQLGWLKDAPVNDFRWTTRVAVHKLYR
ncbi:hypothetical protein U9R90_17705 [Streptomyces sp. E11-3]|uniref:hypothetical protein n=1 Tax=Streptomyces sp. E11-3 TaxID=3110112 RepID=UPI003980FC56